METTNTHLLSTENAVEEAAQHLFTSLTESQFFLKPSLFLLSGGSCVNVAQQFCQLLPNNFDLSLTTFGLADERWVQPGSPESNEQQLREKGVIQALELRGAQWISILGKNDSAEMTALELNSQYLQLFSEKKTIGLLAGMGEDGHTAGILPDLDSVQFYQKFSSNQLVSYYELNPEQNNPHHKRITITLTAISKITTVYLYATGEQKRQALKHLINKDETVNNAPVLGLFLSEQPLMIMTDLSL